eukprot:TCONS_00003410-protein
MKHLQTFLLLIACSTVYTTTDQQKQSHVEFDEELEDYPPHDPIMQPFDEPYEDELKFEEERVKSQHHSTKPKQDSEEEPIQSYGAVEEDTDQDKTFRFPDYPDSEDDDHEPVYQPEDPGEIPYSQSDEKILKQESNTNVKKTGDEKQKDQKEEEEEIQTYGEPNKVEEGVKEHSKQQQQQTQHNVYDAEDDHEPVYQPEDPGELGNDVGNIGVNGIGDGGDTIVVNDDVEIEVHDEL